jgi:hypothetical protein
MTQFPDFTALALGRPDGDAPVLTGQRVVTRLRMQPKPLLVQWYQSARQLFQRRFRI